MGSVPGSLGGLNLGGLDLSSMLSNPALMNMVCSAFVLSVRFCITDLYLLLTVGQAMPGLQQSHWDCQNSVLEAKCLHISQFSHLESLGNIGEFRW